MKKYSYRKLTCIDLGCGTRKQKGYIDVDNKKLEEVNVVYDTKRGLSFKDNSIDRIYSNFLFEHINNFIPFMQELYRVCRDEANYIWQVLLLKRRNRRNSLCKR